MAVEDDALHVLRINEHASIGTFSSMFQSKDEKRVARVRMGRVRTVREGGRV